MSKIVEKNFSPQDLIKRSIFRGSPSLFTTADLNRQIQALKQQIDTLEGYIGRVNTSMSINHTLASGTLKVTIQAQQGYVEFKGYHFEADLFVGTLSINLTSSAPTAYLCLVANAETVTYEDDFEHRISGALFEDGTSQPAADQVVYKNAKLELTHSLSTLSSELVAIIQVYRYIDETLEVIDNTQRGTIYATEEYDSNKALVSKIDGLFKSYSGVFTDGMPGDVGRYELNIIGNFCYGKFYIDTTDGLARAFKGGSSVPLLFPFPLGYRPSGQQSVICNVKIYGVSTMDNTVVSTSNNSFYEDNRFILTYNSEHDYWTLPAFSLYTDVKFGETAGVIGEFFFMV